MRKEISKKWMFSAIHPSIRNLNPRIIFAVVSAFGPKGPDRDHGGFDYQGQAGCVFIGPWLRDLIFC